MDTGSPWLTDAQQRLWRNWLTLNVDLPAAMQREMQADAGLSLPDFSVLVRLSESPDGRIRVTDLAKSLSWERSRLSHHVTRMENRGLVIREECPSDARSAFVSVTTLGRATIEDAAPEHARAVRSLLFDHLTAEEVTILNSALTKVLTNLSKVHH